MTSSLHPRRRHKPSSPPLTPPASPPTPALLKSETFSPRSPSSDLYHPIENARFIPKRSPTTLADLVLDDADDDGYRHENLARFLSDIDKVVDGQIAASSDVLNLDEVWAVAEAHAPEPMVIDEKKDEPDNHHHYSDSGLGSSVDSTIEQGSVPSGKSNAATTTTLSSAINFSHSFEAVHRPRGRRLTTSAFQHIDQHFLQPILKDPELKDFHPLIEAIPQQVGDNFISNLRDLEKTLLYQAPKFCLSSKSFTDFWSFSIRCLHSTVQYLNDRDQRRPTDRPYTSTYFVDLVEQIRRYADVMARTRERQANGEDLDEMDYSPDETIRLEGGISSSGRPAGLVRMRNGKSIPLAPENGRFSDNVSLKRSLSDDEYDSDDEDVMRSMARRRKSDKAADVVHACRSCNKEFKRPCDLTKHEKTHSRPFKCSDSSCRYHDLGWPTEKERDRHENDKHSNNPTLYKCEFQPCSYSSKRESNCKQHMEKAHGWTYVRSKSNGKKRATDITAPSPFSSHATSPGSSNPSYGSPESLQTPLSPPELFNASYDSGRRGSITTEGTPFSANASPYGFSLETMHPGKAMMAASPLVADVNFDFSAPLYQSHTPALPHGFEFDFDSPELLSSIPSASAISTFADPLQTTLQSNLEPFNFDESAYESSALRGIDFQLFDDSTSGASNLDLFPNSNLDFDLSAFNNSAFYQQ